MKKSVKLYGIKNCSTVQKAIKWLTNKDFEVEFHDFKKEKLTEELIGEWLSSIPVETLINKRGLTWRKLTDEEKDMIHCKNISGLIITYPTILKRPVVNHNNDWLVGFNESEWLERF